MSSGESKSNTPWVTRKWKDRREQLVARTATCERCQASFTKTNPANVNHLKKRYELPDGGIDWDSYIAMADDEVEVICKRCHWSFTKYGVYPGDPKITCPKCGKGKLPQFDSCSRCYKSSSEYTQKQAARAQEVELEKRHAVVMKALDDSAECPHGCKQVRVLEEGNEETGNTLAECVLVELIKRYPHWYRRDDKMGI